MLQQRYPQLVGRVHGEHFPVPPLRQALGSIVGFVQMGGLAMLFVGGPIFRALGFAEPPAWYNQLLENKMMLFGGYFFLNMLNTQLLSTGAFEVYYEGAQIYSKIETGRMPSLQELTSVLESRYHLRPLGL